MVPLSCVPLSCGTVSNLAGDTFTYRYMSEDTPGAGNLIHSLTTAPFGAASNFELKTSNTYEVSRNVLLTKENKAGTTNISTYTYGVNDIGQRISLSTSGDAFGAAAPSLTWGYNARGELTSAANATTGTHNRGYNYDVIGNRIESVTGTTTLTGTSNYTSNALNQYTQVPAPSAPLQPDYDLDGNATSYPLPELPDAKATLTWDAENRLIKVLRPAQGGQPAMEIDYDYDYLSRRITKTTGGTSTHYLYDSWNCVAEYTLTSSVLNLTSSYTWGLDLSGSMQGAGGVGGLLAVTHESVAGTPAYYPTYDGNGNVSEYLDNAGAVAVHFEYDPFGNTVVDTDTDETFDIRFSTKKLDLGSAETGLYYYGYRYYDPQTGRWPSRDPIGERGGFNVYGFVGNSPINYLDIFGLVPVTYISPDPMMVPIENTEWKRGRRRKWFGATEYADKEVSCVCGSINGEEKVCKISCAVSFSAKIIINTLKTSDEFRPKVVSHERRHVMSRAFGVKEEVVEPLEQEPEIEYKTWEECDTAAIELQEEYQKKLDDYFKKNNHADKDGGNQFSPGTHEAPDPITPEEIDEWEMEMLD